ncbi:MAG: FAD-dependent oxidoreductase [Chloroflexi bacterium]|nr:FAD-dependent oxidoreductase [Chloroflexota bacterium]
MARVVVIGGGFSGCSAAITAARTGAEVVLLEKLDTLSGLGPWTGQLMTWVARQETKLTGGGGKDIIEALESIALHRKTELGVPGGNVTFDVTKVEGVTRGAVERAGVKVVLRSRVVNVLRENDCIKAVVLDNGTLVEGDAFVDATGNAGGLAICKEYGQGCALCTMKCPIYGDRVSVSVKAGVPDITRPKARYFPHTLIFTGSLSADLREKVEKAEGGYSYHPIPTDLQEHDFSQEWPRTDHPVVTKLRQKAIEIVHIPFAKAMITLPLRFLRSIPGFENAWLLNPLAALAQCLSVGAVAPRDNSLKVESLDNLFCAGERSGHVSAIVECLFTGDLAGHNAARVALGLEPIVISTSTMIGFYIAEVKDGYTYTDWPKGIEFHPRYDKYKERGFHSTDLAQIRKRLDEAGILGIYQNSLAQVPA